MDFKTFYAANQQQFVNLGVNYSDVFQMFRNAEKLKADNEHKEWERKWYIASTEKTGYEWALNGGDCTAKECKAKHNEIITERMKHIA